MNVLAPMTLRHATRNLPILRIGGRSSVVFRRLNCWYLNLINQGDALFNGGRLNLTKIILTYAGPYCVATYGAVSYNLKVAKR